MKTFRIGMVASLADVSSVHRHAFIRAHELFCNSIKDKGAAELSFIWADDKASAEGGKKSAASFLDKNVDCVIGHFASASALAGLEVYQNTIPVFLPASTLDSLTSNYSNAYRLIGKDSDLARLILQDLTNSDRTIRISLQHDNSIHGKSVCAAIEHLSSSFNIIVGDNNSKVNYTIYSGSFQNSMMFLNTHDAEIPLILTDDAVHPLVMEHIAAHHNSESLNLKIYGFGPTEWISGTKELNQKYFEVYHQHPSTYFAETYAALQIAFDLSKHTSRTENNADSMKKVLQSKKWNTIFGPIQFSMGECGIYNYARWTARNNSFSAQRIILH